MSTHIDAVSFAATASGRGPHGGALGGDMVCSDWQDIAGDDL
jgi:hypothetical protein